MDNIEFKKAELKDIPYIMRIEELSFHEEICESRHVFVDRIKVFKDGFFVLKCRGEVIGYISSEIWNSRIKYDRDIFSLGHCIKESHNENGDEIYISSIGLMPNYRGRGLGKLLFNKFMNSIRSDFPKIKSSILIVSENWDNAIKIYKSNGFKVINSIENFFNYKTKNKAGIVMKKLLKDNFL